jgi:DNA-binding NarL/FixJ family response regulator
VEVGNTVIGEHGLVAIISRYPRCEVCGTHTLTTRTESFDNIALDLLLILPFLEHRDAIRWIRDLAMEFPRVRILIVSRQSQLTDAERGVRAGASGLLDEEQLIGRTNARD